MNGLAVQVLYPTVNTILPIISAGIFMEYVGPEEAIDLMEYVDEVLCDFDGGVTKIIFYNGVRFKNRSIA